MNIGMISSSKSFDISSWSGTPYYMAKALNKHCGNVDFIGPISCRREVVFKFLSFIYESIIKRKYDFNRSIFVAKMYARIAEKKLRDKRFDVLIAPAGAQYIAFLKTEVPIVLVLDATFALMKDYYPGFSNLSTFSIRHGNIIAKLASQRARILLFSSDWAAKSAMQDYGAEKDKIHVIPFGANLDEKDIPPRDFVLNKRRSDMCRLLFLGVDWVRKGGGIAFDTLLELRKFDIPVELIVCGCIPPRDFVHNSMRVIPFLDKNNRDDLVQLLDLFCNADFLLVPTRNEAYGLVFCEANAFGLPSITTNTGGVSGIVKDGENGFLLPLEATGNDYALLIRDIWKNEGKYHALSQSSRDAFEKRLNWDTWGRTVNKLLKMLI